VWVDLTEPGWLPEGRAFFLRDAEFFAPGCCGDSAFPDTRGIGNDGGLPLWGLRLVRSGDRLRLGAEHVATAFPTHSWSVRSSTLRAAWQSEQGAWLGAAAVWRGRALRLFVDGVWRDPGSPLLVEGTALLWRARDQTWHSDLFFERWELGATEPDAPPHDETEVPPRSHWKRFASLRATWRGELVRPWVALLPSETTLLGAGTVLEPRLGRFGFEKLTLATGCVLDLDLLPDAFLDAQLTSEAGYSMSLRGSYGRVAVRRRPWLWQSATAVERRGGAFALATPRTLPLRAGAGLDLEDTSLGSTLSGWAVVTVIPRPGLHASLGGRHSGCRRQSRRDALQRRLPASPSGALPRHGPPPVRLLAAVAGGGGRGTSGSSPPALGLGMGA